MALAMVGRAHAAARAGERVWCGGSFVFEWIAGADIWEGEVCAVLSDDGLAYPVRSGSVTVPGRIESIATTVVVK